MTDYEKKYRSDWVDLLGEMPFLIWLGVPAFLLWMVFFPQDAHAWAGCYNTATATWVAITINPASGAAGIPCADQFTLTTVDLQLLKTYLDGVAQVTAIISPADVLAVFSWGFAAVSLFAGLGIAISAGKNAIQKL